MCCDEAANIAIDSVELKPETKYDLSEVINRCYDIFSNACLIRNLDFIGRFLYRLCNEAVVVLE